MLKNFLVTFAFLIVAFVAYAIHHGNLPDTERGYSIDDCENFGKIAVTAAKLGEVKVPLSSVLKGTESEIVVKVSSYGYKWAYNPDFARKTILETCKAWTIDQFNRNAGAGYLPDIVAAPSSNQIAVPTTKLKNFDIDTKSLPKNFVPIDPKQLAMALKNLKFAWQPTKYETKTDFNTRLKNLKSTIIFDEVMLGGGFAFSGGKIGYNADKAAIVFSSEYSIDSALQMSIETENIGGLTPEIIRDRFGWLVEGYVKDRRATDYTRFIYLDTDKFKGMGKITMEYKLHSERAKELENDLGVLFVGNVTSPYYHTDLSYPSGDRTAFFDRTDIVFDLKGVWLVNFKTGEILSKKYATCTIDAAACKKQGV